MKNIYYKSKNSNYPGCSVDEIKNDEFKAGFNFRIADGTEYTTIFISNIELQLRNKNGDILYGLIIKNNNFREIFKKLLDIAGIKLRDIPDNGEELDGIDFGEEEFGLEEEIKYKDDKILKSPSTLLSELFKECVVSLPMDFVYDSETSPEKISASGNTKKVYENSILVNGKVVGINTRNLYGFSTSMSSFGLNAKETVHSVIELKDGTLFEHNGIKNRAIIKGKEIKISELIIEEKDGKDELIKFLVDKGVATNFNNGKAKLKINSDMLGSSTGSIEDESHFIKLVKEETEIKSKVKVLNKKIKEFKEAEKQEEAQYEGNQSMNNPKVDTEKIILGKTVESTGFEIKLEGFKATAFEKEYLSSLTFKTKEEFNGEKERLSEELEIIRKEISDNMFKAYSNFSKEDDLGFEAESKEFKNVVGGKKFFKQINNGDNSVKIRLFTNEKTI